MQLVRSDATLIAGPFFNLVICTNNMASLTHTIPQNSGLKLMA